MRNVASYPLVFVAKLYHTQEQDGAEILQNTPNGHLIHLNGLLIARLIPKIR